MTKTEPPYERLTFARAARALALAIGLGVLLVLAPYALAWLRSAITHDDFHEALIAVSGFTLGITLLMPLVQGFVLAMAMGPGRFTATTTCGLVFALSLIELAGGMIILHEGAICLLMAAPFLIAIMLLAALIGRLVARANVNPAVHVSIAPLIALAVFAEATGPKPDYATSVADSVTINAPASDVWRYVLTYPENNTPAEYWLWRIGLPEPIQSVAEAPHVGAKRVCRFTGGAAFEERITELTPGHSMTFAVTKQPEDPEVLGHFQFEQGRIELHQNPDGTTTVTATSWYHLYVRPAEYFNLWATDITRQVHFRVLNHIKRLAEHDHERGA